MNRIPLPSEVAFSSEPPRIAPPDIRPEAQAVGRLILDADLVNLLLLAPELGDDDFVIHPIMPALHYFTRRFTDSLATKLPLKKRFKVPPEAPIPRTVSDSQELLDALHYAETIDQATAFEPINLRTEGIIHKTYQEKAHQHTVRVVLHDATSDFYDAGWQLRGEVNAAEAMRKPHQAPKSLPETEIPLQRIPIMEIHTLDYDRLDRFSSQLFEMIGGTFLVSEVRELPVSIDDLPTES